MIKLLTALALAFTLTFMVGCDPHETDRPEIVIAHADIPVAFDSEPLEQYIALSDMMLQLREEGGGSVLPEKQDLYDEICDKWVMMTVTVGKVKQTIFFVAPELHIKCYVMERKGRLARIKALTSNFHVWIEYDKLERVMKARTPLERALNRVNPMRNTIPEE